MTITRKSELVKGYDCVHFCNDPRHVDTFGKPYRSSGQSHGRDMDRWQYAIQTDEAAVVLIVRSWEQSTVLPELWTGLIPKGDALSLHVPWKMYPEQIRNDEGGDKGCQWIPSGCYSSAQYTTAKRFFERNGDPSFEQREDFWKRLEELALQLIAESKAKAAEFTLERCNHCDGAGVMPKAQKTAEAMKRDQVNFYCPRLPSLLPGE
jgi:hypothetical protein